MTTVNTPASQRPWPAVTTIRALVWFPKMQADIDYHWNSCACCVAKHTATEPAGTAVRARRRLKMIETDKILEPSVVAATGCAAILTLVDVVARITMYVPSAHSALLTQHLPFTPGGTHCSEPLQ